VRRAVRGDLQVRVDREGITVGAKRFEWDEVVTIRSASGRNSVVALVLTPEAARRARARPPRTKRPVPFYLPTVNGYRSRPMAEWLEQLRRAHADRSRPTA